MTSPDKDEFEDFPFRSNSREWIEGYAQAMRNCAADMKTPEERDKFLEAAREAERFLAAADR